MPPERGRPRRLSLDSNVLVGFGEQRHSLLDFLNLAHEIGHELCVTETTLAETAHLARTAEESSLRRAARCALALREEWKIRACLPATLAQRRAAEELAAWLRARGWIPTSQYRDSLIIAETSVARIPI
jgi:predicted nucleic acid-binding protein